MATPSKTAARPAPGKTPPAPAKQPARTAPPAQAARPAPAAKPAAPAPKANVPAQRQTTAVATTDVPEHIKNMGVARGSENVDMQDLVIPRIELVQALSKCLDRSAAEYIEGAQAGMFYNSVTRELYGENVIVCPVFFRKQWLAWKDRKQGGGFGGAFDTNQECLARINEEQDPAAWESIETAQQIVLVVNMDTYDTHEAIVSMARTKMKVSRQWNSLIRINGFDRFSRLYDMFGTDEKNARNEGYKNIGIRLHDWAPVDVYKKGEALYESIATGAVKVKADDTYDDDSVIDGESGGGQDPNAPPPEY